MPFPDDVIKTALYEAAVQNGWKTNKSRVKEYIRSRAACLRSPMTLPTLA